MSILEKWELPDELKEVSGIALMSEGKFACVQDEIGTIFIYDASQEKITDQIKFAGAGDFEGITLNGNSAYVLRADGVILKLIFPGKVLRQMNTRPS